MKDISLSDLQKISGGILSMGDGTATKEVPSTGIPIDYYHYIDKKINERYNFLITSFQLYEALSHVPSECVAQYYNNMRQVEWVYHF